MADRIDVYVMDDDKIDINLEVALFQSQPIDRVLLVYGYH